MKNVFLIFSILTIYCSPFTGLQAQNLVPNPSFEYYTQCPWTIGQISFAFPWLHSTPGHPEYFNTCADTNSGLSIPNNAVGYEYARTGQGYVGFYSFYKWIEGRDYLQVQLKDSLQPNTSYCVEFYINLADKFNYAVNNLGAFFSSYPISSGSDLLLYTPQIINSSLNPLTNKNGWKKVLGSFVSAGGEEYLTIGNFNNDANSDTIRVDTLGISWDANYYYIDDVSVYSCDAPVYSAVAGKNLTICKGDSIQIGSIPRNEYLYRWHPFSSLSNDSIANPWAKPTSTITYYLTQKDFKFDETTDSIKVTVILCEDTTENSFTIPNAFTPNNDSYNDNFSVHGQNIKSISGKIFNRWGQELFNFSNPTDAWDGKYKGNDVSEGVYFYIVSVTFNDGEVQEKHGSVQLIR